ncbi:MAG TPA: sigma-70 family RNA polymerase sigma factor [Planctomycetaceae bacterium]|jgi:RNA polymerase sigma-70 factor (ECF subfamily)|nr:sigma-70 family RNA polymerase sigma factor [Planctomycetaceae bacterium]
MTTLSVPNAMREQPPADEARDQASFVARLCQKDPAACEVLVRQFGGKMLSTARRYLRCDQDSADAVQEAFLSAFQAIGTFAGQSRLETWLHRILVNVCLMKLRTRSRQQACSIEELLPAFDESGHYAKPVRSWRGPDERLLRDETRALVRHYIDRLPDDYRTVLLLRDIEQLSTEETARLLEAAPNTIKTRLHRARQALRTLLDPHFKQEQ